jgi:hypothetical protein
MTHKLNGAWVVVPSWFIANLLGVAAVAALRFIPPLETFRPGMLVSSLVIGLPIGLAQWLVLRRIAPVSPLWTLTISVALPLALAVLNSPISGRIWEFLGDDESVLSLTAGYLTIGFFVGLVQWLFLRAHFARSFVWLLSTAVGLGLGIGPVFASNLIYQSGIISIILVVLVYAIATGSVISWMQVSSTNTEIDWVDAT